MAATGQLNNGVEDLMTPELHFYDFGLTGEEVDLCLKKQESQMHEALERRKTYKQMVQSNQNANGTTTITFELIVNGLKYIAEHPDLNQYELVQGLLDLGCNFSRDYIKMYFKNETCQDLNFLLKGASIIAYIRDSELFRSIYAKRFLTEDTYNSIFKLIRHMTGDTSYTKDNLELDSTSRKMTP